MFFIRWLIREMGKGVIYKIKQFRCAFRKKINGLKSIFKKLVSERTGFPIRIRLEYSDPMLEFITSYRG
jgi:hypothetical protein